MRPTPTATHLAFVPQPVTVINPSNAANLEVLAELPAIGVSVAAFTSDEHWLATGIFADGAVKVWNFFSGQVAYEIPPAPDTRILSNLAYSPDGSRLASSSLGWYSNTSRFAIWDASNGALIKSFEGCLGAVSPDWQTIALTRQEQPEGAQLTIIDAGDFGEISSIPARSDIYEISFSPDGTTIASKMYQVIQDLFTFWDLEKGIEERTLYDWQNFSFSPDGRFIGAILDTGKGDVGSLKVFDAHSWKGIKEMNIEANGLWFTTPEFSPDGGLLAASTPDGVLIWETDTWKLLASLPVYQPAGAAFSPAGHYLLTFTQKGAPQIWGVVASSSN